MSDQPDRSTEHLQTKMSVAIMKILTETGSAYKKEGYSIADYGVDIMLTGLELMALGTFTMALSYHTAGATLEEAVAMATKDHLTSDFLKDSEALAVINDEIRRHMEAFKEETQGGLNYHDNNSGTKH